MFIELKESLLLQSDEEMISINILMRISVNNTMLNALAHCRIIINPEIRRLLIYMLKCKIFNRFY
jgi:hypothetical protein